MNPTESDSTGLTETEAIQRIVELKRELGKRVVILVHHYQRDEIMQFADYRGDSLELSRIAAKEAGAAEYIVFCGVDFMAETAAMLCHPGQTVLLPAQDAGCPMARMADAADAQVAWDFLAQVWNDDLLPITYQNSYAEVKAFCGRRGGAVCTSANCASLFRWALARRGHILFLPDEHLGTNTALALGIPRDRIAVWDPEATPRDSNAFALAQVVVWKGYCHVHTCFTVEHVRAIRAKYGPITVIVHPECPAEVVQAADLSGSTSFIIQAVEAAPAGARFAVGTEINMVSRLAKDNPEKFIVPLTRSLCGTMFRTNVFNLLETLQSVLDNQPIGIVRVEPEIARWANVALERMLSVK
jgi:quinolinate synthase